MQDVAFFPAMPFPGTALADEAEKLLGRDIQRGAVMDTSQTHGRSFAANRLRKYSAKPEMSVNSLFNSSQLRLLVGFAYERFDTGQRVIDLAKEFGEYMNGKVVSTHDSLQT